MELKNKKINFIGDSITAGVGTSDISKVYHALIAEREGCIARNYGVSGSRIAKHIPPEGTIGCRMPFCERVHRMDLDADMIVIFGGTNDYGGGIPLTGHGFDDTDLYTFYGACHHLIQSSLELYPGKPVIFMTPLHRSGEDYPRTLSGSTLIQYVQMIRDVCEVYSIPVCDLYANSGIAADLPQQREIYIPDGLHPNDAGNEIIASRLTQFIKSL